MIINGRKEKSKQTIKGNNSIGKRGLVASCFKLYLLREAFMPVDVRLVFNRQKSGDGHRQNMKAAVLFIKVSIVQSL